MPSACIGKNRSATRAADERDVKRALEQIITQTQKEKIPTRNAREFIGFWIKKGETPAFGRLARAG